MKIFPEIKKIAGKSEAVERLSEKLSEKLDDTVGVCLDFKRAHLITGCKERLGHLYDADGDRLDFQGLIDDTYYCRQYTGYCEDAFYGTLFFKTNVPGQFVAVPFEC